MAFHPLSLTEPGVSSPTLMTDGCRCVAAGFSRPSTWRAQAKAARARMTTFFMAGDSRRMQNAECRMQTINVPHSSFCIHLLYTPREFGGRDGRNRTQ